MKYRNFKVGEYLMTNNYNPWNASNYNAFQVNETPPTIGGIGIGFTNDNYMNPPYNYYNQQQGQGYYNSLYNQCYNPYVAQQQYEEQQKLYREKQIEKIRFYNELDKMFYSYEGVEFKKQSPEEQLKEAEEYYQYLSEMNRIKQEHSGFSMEGFVLIEWDPQPTQQIQEPQEEEHVDFGEWMDSLGYEYAQILMRRAKEQRNDLKQAYDSNQYRQLLNMHNNSQNVIDAFTRDFTIDDMEITLPDRFNKEYQERRKRFLDAIIN